MVIKSRGVKGYKILLGKLEGKRGFVVNIRVGKKGS
jgi:hypothetical protein